MFSLNFFQLLQRTRKIAFLLGSLTFFMAVGFVAAAQRVLPQQLVQQVVDKELAADQNDHTHWAYRDADKLPGKSTLKLVIETSQGTISRTIELNGLPLNAEQRAQDEAKINDFVNDPSVRAKKRKANAHDDDQAISLMKMLPNAFLWTEAGESNGEITFHFQPNPSFQPPTYASRVFAAMAGEMVIDAEQKRLKVLSGTLIQPVEYGWGLLGKLQKGGTFRVVRSEVAPGEWQITQTHVHIQGHALIFKSINEQEDEETNDYKRVPPSLTLNQAVQMLNNESAVKDLNSKTHP